MAFTTVWSLFILGRIFIVINSIVSVTSGELVDIADAIIFYKRRYQSFSVSICNEIETDEEKMIR